MRQLLEDLRQGEAIEAFEAAKTLARLPCLPANHLIEIFERAESLHNRQATAYALSWLLRKNKNGPLRALLGIVDNADEHPAVRGQALEGLGIQRPTGRHSLWPELERAVLDALRDKSVEVRFWACYAAGTLRMKSALPRLRDLAHNDLALYPSWWRVSEEAADAVEWIFGRQTQSRPAISGPNQAD